METVTDFLYMGSKITEDGDYSHEIKRCSLLGRKAFTNIHSILGSKDIKSVSPVQSLSHVLLFVTPWIAAHQASLSIANSRSLLKLITIELVMPFSHIILCRLLLFLPSSLSHHQGLFKWVSSSHQVAKLLEFQLQHQSIQWTPRTDLL